MWCCRFGVFHLLRWSISRRSSLHLHSSVSLWIPYITVSSQEQSMDRSVCLLVCLLLGLSICLSMSLCLCVSEHVLMSVFMGFVFCLSTCVWFFVCLCCCGFVSICPYVYVPFCVFLSVCRCISAFLCLFDVYWMYLLLFLYDSCITDSNTTYPLNNNFYLRK